jgi:hypothetical protein
LSTYLHTFSVAARGDCGDFGIAVASAEPRMYHNLRVDDREDPVPGSAACSIAPVAHAKESLRAREVVRPAVRSLHPVIRMADVAYRERAHG